MCKANAEQHAPKEHVLLGLGAWLRGISSPGKAQIYVLTKCLKHPIITQSYPHQSQTRQDLPQPKYVKHYRADKRGKAMTGLKNTIM